VMSIMDFGMSLAGAELLFIIIRSSDLQIIIKSHKQRIEAERNQITRGLARSFVLEMLLFVPASVLLVFLAVRPFLLATPSIQAVVKNPNLNIAFHSSLGIASYGFPFASVRYAVTFLALQTLKQFAIISGRMAAGASAVGDTAKTSERSPHKPTLPSESRRKGKDR
jgi:hypothetical protein